MSIRLKSTEKTPACVSMWAFLQPISARIYFGKTASHRKRARLVQSRGASPQAYWMSVKAAQRRGCAKRAFCGVCFLMPGGLTAGDIFCIFHKKLLLPKTFSVILTVFPPSGGTPLHAAGRQKIRRNTRCGWRCGSVETCRKALRAMPVRGRLLRRQDGYSQDVWQRSF